MVLLNSMVVVFYTKTYSYSFVFSDAFLGAIFATIQLAFHKLNGRKKLPFYLQYLYTLIGFTIFWSVVFGARSGFSSSIEFIFILSFFSSIPASCIAYLVNVRLLKYDTRT